MSHVEQVIALAEQAPAELLREAELCIHDIDLIEKLEAILGEAQERG